MTRLYQDFEGVPNAAAPSAANTAGGGPRNTAISDTVAIGGLLGTTTNPIFGKTSLSLLTSITAISEVGWAGQTVAGPGLLAAYINLPHAPVTNAYIMLQLRAAGGAAASAAINPSGQLTMINAAGATVGTAIGSLAPWYGLPLLWQIYASPGTTTSNGSIRIQVTDPTGNGLERSNNASVNAGVLSTDPITTGRMGKQGTAAAYGGTAATLFFDGLVMDTASTGYMSQNEGDFVWTQQIGSRLMVPVSRAAIF